MKKKSFIMKNDFFFGAEILKSYCPVCIVREKEKKNFVLQYSFVLQRMKLVDAWVVLQ